MYGKFAGLYDPLMKDVDYDRWAEYIASFLPEGSLRIADCACGTGEITIRLAKMGYTLTGIDISEDMLRIAAEKARKSALKLPFICQNMAELQLHRPQDAIVCACDGVNYLDSLEQVGRFFSAAYAVLKPNGLLLFDISSRHKLENVLDCNTFAEDDGERAYIWKNCYDPESRLISMELSFYEKQGEFYRRFEESHIQRAHEEKELLSAMEKAGFDAAAYGFLTRRQAAEDCQRIQFIGRKRK
ncbi:MAG: methyltransferase domain-containing protein [Clostridia bacterium]|nr:methyltransferase domain-containing protein [Clostridia bacterium]